MRIVKCILNNYKVRRYSIDCTCDFIAGLPVSKHRLETIEVRTLSQMEVITND